MKNILSIISISVISLSCQHKVPQEAGVPSGGYRPSQNLIFSREKAEAKGQKHVISTQGIASTQIAEDVLKKNGNLIDAFVAASFAISVERPQSTGLGGGGFLVFHDAKTKKTFAVDFRERAPFRAKRDMYIDVNGQPQTKLAQDGVLAAGTPGIVKGLWEVHKKFGKLPWAQLVTPSVQLARNGFEIYEDLYLALEDRKAVLAEDPEAKKIFLNEKGEPRLKGSILKQEDLAKTLETIAKLGANGFYGGRIAQSFENLSKAKGGLIYKKDLTAYKVKWRKPVEGEFMGHKLYSMPPPSSGGVLVYQFLKMLEEEKPTLKDLNTADEIHLQAAVLQSIFADRAVHFGDPDFHKVPVQGLLEPAYLNQRRQNILPGKARNMNDVQAGAFKSGYESTDTTHMSMMDSEGNAISSTQTVNGWMGAGVVVPGTGILLNNEMDDFSIQAGTANLYGAIGGKANEIQPLKTPLSSMSPTIILDSAHKPVMAIGGMGGTTIISCTAKTIYNYFFYKLPLWESMTNMRIHHQWSPDQLQIEEPGPAPTELQKLKDFGYDVKVQPFFCNVMATARSGAEMTAVSDPRDIGTSRGN